MEYTCWGNYRNQKSKNRALLGEEIQDQSKGVAAYKWSDGGNEGNAVEGLCEKGDRYTQKRVRGGLQKH